MRLTAVLFPAKSRTFPGLRWLNITLRSLHLIGMAGMAGNYFHAATFHALFNFWALTLLSGAAMVVLSIWSDGRWLLQLRGAAIMFKLLLLGSLPWWERLFSDGAAWGMVVIILISSVISHAPGRVRYFFVLRPADVSAL